MRKPGKLGSLFKKSQPPTAYQLNQFHSKIFEKGALVSNGGGNYTSYFQIDGEVYWKYTDPVVKWIVETEPNVLPSSVTKMEIVELLNESKWEEADKWIDGFE